MQALLSFVLDWRLRMFHRRTFKSLVTTIFVSLAYCRFVISVCVRARARVRRG